MIGAFLLTLGLSALAQATSTDGSFMGRPIYSEPSTGLQLPPGCEVDPAWRAPIAGTDLQIWVSVCPGGPRVWLLKRQVVEMVNDRQARLRFVVLDERVYPEETAGETLSVACSGSNDEGGYAVRGAHWRPDGKELRLKAAKGALRADSRNLKLADAELNSVDCVRVPEREAMLKRLQQHN